METKRWTDADFDAMSWHDNHVHALEIRSGDHSAGELLLGLGYILEWLPPVQGVHTFRIAPAVLHFRDVIDLSIQLDYATPSAALTPFSISSITKDVHAFPTRGHTYRWKIDVNWPEGSITFLASGYSQSLTGPAVVTPEQFLSLAQRRGEGQPGNRA